MEKQKLVYAMWEDKFECCKEVLVVACTQARVSYRSVARQKQTHLATLPF